MELSYGFDHLPQWKAVPPSQLSKVLWVKELDVELAISMVSSSGAARYPHLTHLIL